ncbi:hypothetical protein BRD16_04870 [Halobacteriales archaeon SW_6_65_46]|nr:MAG: hypothetical protein BRD16_04870 [Halobacteriales archaeon SW_6_65_46]
MTTLFAAPLIAVFGQGIVESPLLQILITFGGYVTAAGLYIRLSKRGVQFLDIERPTRTEVVVALATFGAILIVQLIGTGLTPSGGTALGTNMNVESVMLLLAIIVSGAFFIPVAEELLFRNILQKILSKNISAQIAIVSVSLVFMLLHIGNYSLTTPVQAGIGLSSVFVQSIVLGLAYERTENILVPISAHAIYNLIAYSTLTASLVG